MTVDADPADRAGAAGGVGGRPPPTVVDLPSGARVMVRSLVPEDAAAIALGVGRLSARSRFQRFFAGTRRLGAAQLAYLTRIDHHDHEALVALDPVTDELLGVARFVRSRDDATSAEIAVTIADPWQGRGLGTALLRLLVGRAREEGVTRFTAEIQADNLAMRALLRHAGPVTTGPDGVLTADIE